MRYVVTISYSPLDKSIRNDNSSCSSYLESIDDPMLFLVVCACRAEELMAWWFMSSIESRGVHGHEEQWQHNGHEGLDRFRPL
jgi:hypothetical protein